MSRYPLLSTFTFRGEAQIQMSFLGFPPDDALGPFEQLFSGMSQVFEEGVTGENRESGEIIIQLAKGVISA